MCISQFRWFVRYIHIYCTFRHIQAWKIDGWPHPQFESVDVRFASSERCILESPEFRLLMSLFNVSNAPDSMHCHTYRKWNIQTRKFDGSLHPQFEPMNARFPSELGLLVYSLIYLMHHLDSIHGYTSVHINAKSWWITRTSICMFECKNCF